MTYRLFLLNPDVMMDALVNEPAGVTYPIAEIGFDNITAGAYTTALSGQTVTFGGGSHSDDTVGRQRLRLDSAIDTIYISRSSQGTRDGEVDIEDNTPFRVHWDYRVWFTPGVIDADGTIYKDHDIAFVANSRPVANIGVGTAADIDSGSGVLRVQFPHTAQTSFATMPGATITGYLWGLPAGAALVAGYNLTDAFIQVDFDPGFYWISLEVTDSNGQTHKARCPVYARDPANDLCIQNFQIDELSASVNGQRLRVRILDDIDMANYPDGSLVMLWDDTQIGGVTSRTHMQFIGWHTIDPATFEAQRTGNISEVILECVDVAGRLAALPGFPQHIEHNATPSTWYQMNEPTIDRMLHYLLDRHTTALELADFHWSGTGSTYKFVVRGLDGENYWDQCQRLCKGLSPDYMLSCDRFGILNMVVDPMLQDSGDRTVTIQDTIGDDDFEYIQYTHQRPPRFHWTRGDGIVASWSEIAALFSVAPGGTPGQGEMSQPKGEQLIVDQTGLNATTGHYYARINAPQSFFTIRLARTDTVGIEPADMTWVRLDLVAPYTLQRNLLLANERGLVHEVRRSFVYEPAFAETVELLWERETVGKPAVTEIMPPPPPEPPPPPPPPPDPGPGPPPEPGGDGLGIVHVMVAAGLGRTDNLSAGTSATWIDTTGSISGTLYDFILDPFDPANTAYCLASSGVWKTANVEAASVTWTNVLTSAAITAATGGFEGFGMIECHIGDEDWVAFSFRSASNTLEFAVSTDGGSTWNYYDVATYGSTGGNGIPVFSTVQHVVGDSKTIYYTMAGGSPGNYRPPLWKSTDGGATWAVVYDDYIAPSVTGSVNPTIHAPYEGNEGGNIVWFCYGQTGSNAFTKLAVSTDGGVTFTEMADPTFSQFRGQVETWTGSNNTVWYWDTTGDDTINVSTDGGATWDSKAGPGGNIKGAGGFPYNSLLYYAVGDSVGILYSLDGGATWTNATNDYPHSFATGDRFVIVPNWLSSGSA